MVIPTTDSEYDEQRTSDYKTGDLKGLKMRVMENQVFIDFFNTLGASATPMGFNELFTGLQQNTVDGQENPPSLIYASKFQEVQKYLSVTEHVNNFLGFIMNKDFYDGLTQNSSRSSRMQRQNS